MPYLGEGRAEKDPMWLEGLVWSVKRIPWISPTTTEECEGTEREEGSDD